MLRNSVVPQGLDEDDEIFEEEKVEDEEDLDESDVDFKLRRAQSEVTSNHDFDLR